MTDLVITDIPWSETYNVVAASSQNYSFTHIETDDVEVIKDGVLMTSGYTVVGTPADQGGFVGGVVNFAPAVTGEITIRRIPTTERTTNIENYGIWDVNNMNKELVQMMANIQHLKNISYELINLYDFDLESTNVVYEDNGIKLAADAGASMRTTITNGLGSPGYIESCYALSDVAYIRANATIADLANAAIPVAKASGSDTASFTQYNIWAPTWVSGVYQYLSLFGWVTKQFTNRKLSARVEVFTFNV